MTAATCVSGRGVAQRVVIQRQTAQHQQLSAPRGTDAARGRTPTVGADSRESVQTPSGVWADRRRHGLVSRGGRTVDPSPGGPLSFPSFSPAEPSPVLRVCLFNMY